jgi:protein-L-isoaspartate O-methyltransferase
LVIPVIKIWALTTGLSYVMVVEQLKPGGRMVIPVGAERGSQTLDLIEKVDIHCYHSAVLYSCHTYKPINNFLNNF